MKVIAKTRSGYILDVSSVEMANILGFPTLSSPGYAVPNEDDVLTVSPITRDVPKTRQDLQELRNSVDAVSARLTQIGF